MTTHFLDEADFLSDNIVILSKGQLKAEGSSAELKHQFGEGYSITVPGHLQGPTVPHIDWAETVQSLDQTVYSVPDSDRATRVMDCLEMHGILDYRVSGPTLEDVFLTLAGDPGPPGVAFEEVELDSLDTDTTKAGNGTGIILHTGRHISPWAQGWVLFCKRLKILRRNYLPYCAAIAVALIGAGVSPLLLKYFEGISCVEVPHDSYYVNYDYANNLNTQYNLELVAGPTTKLTRPAIARLANTYYSPDEEPRYGQTRNVSTLTAAIYKTDTLSDFNTYIAENNSSSPGGFYLGDGSHAPMIAWAAEPQSYYGLINVIILQNAMNIMLSNISIVTSYNDFDFSPGPPLIDFAALLFAIYFPLIFAAYPAFFALYPTLERLRNVRALHYSNGVRPLPLWLAYLAFDSIVILLISLISIILISRGTDQWFNVAYLFPVFVLYGIASALISYIISMFARSPLAAWALVAGGQLVMLFAYMGGYLGVASNVGTADLQSTLNGLQYGIGLISPLANLTRSLFVALNLFGISCGDRSNPGAMTLYGGPILYLVLQILACFGILLWWDSGKSPISLLRKPKAPTSPNAKAQIAQSPEVAAEISHVQNSNSGLRVLHLTKSFSKNLAVDDITFGVQPSETFALLGPNGAGKSTAISLIRGDIAPSTPASEILVDSTSVLRQRAAARARLGVCPQFDASDVLTVTESLRFYARVRGIADPSHNVDTVIRAFGLEPYRHRLAQKLSGGTKRKLSLAIALIGNPSVLLLDEPSSGLDAKSKRVMWKTLSGLKEGRSMVLTTHSMEEADALADRAGVMSGRMLALGTCEALRRRWGDVWRVQCVLRSAPCTGTGEMEYVKSWIRNAIPGANVEEKTYCGQLRFSVPASTNARGHPSIGIGQLFKLLEANKAPLGIEYYSIGQTTMDEVFCTIVHEHGGEEENSGVVVKKRWWKKGEGNV